jgi:hypothetical protein
LIGVIAGKRCSVTVSLSYDAPVAGGIRMALAQESHGTSRAGYRHDGKVAVVTGGASGIGQAIALRLARDGGRVAILDVTDSGDTVQQAARDGLAERIAGWKCDITAGNG